MTEQEQKAYDRLRKALAEAKAKAKQARVALLIKQGQAD